MGTRAERLREVRLRYCITCREPSEDGLCGECARPKRRFPIQEEDRFILTAEVRAKIKRAWVCTCPQCKRLRTKEFVPPPYGLVALEKKHG